MIGPYSVACVGVPDSSAWVLCVVIVVPAFQYVGTFVIVGTGQLKRQFDLHRRPQESHYVSSMFYEFSERGHRILYAPVCPARLLVGSGMSRSCWVRLALPRSAQFPQFRIDLEE